MKANQSFKEADEAVSPVIGVILMVAITVVLAAVVFVLVNDLGSAEDQAPTMGFTKSGGNVTVVKAPAGADAITYADLSFGGSCTVGYFQGGAAGEIPNGTVSAGDSFGGCTSTQTLTISHIGTGTLLKEFSF